MEIRRPKSEAREKPEDRNPKEQTAHVSFSDFGFRISFGFRPSDFGLCLVGVLLLLSFVPRVQAAGSIASWGGGFTNTPSGLSGLIAISCSIDHALALNANGNVFAWGNTDDAQCNVPAGLGYVTAVAAGAYFSLALKSDGTVAAWGDNQWGQCHVPSGLSGIIAISAGRTHCLALRSDHTVVAWGNNDYGQCDVPPGLNNVEAVLARWNYSLALLGNGTVVGWGANDAGQTAIPFGLGNVTAIDGSINYCLALSGGAVVAWGNAPAVPFGLSGVVGIAAGEDHSLALLANGTVTAWGGNESGQLNVPSLTGVTAVAAGWNYSLALVGTAGAAPLILTQPNWSAGTFTVAVPTQSGSTYTLQYKTSLSDSTWTGLSPMAGNGSVLRLTDPSATSSQRFYRVLQQ